MLKELEVLYLHRVHDAQPRVSVPLIRVARLLAFTITIALILPALAFAQTRQQKISDVVQAIDAVDMPILRQEILPAQARKRANEELERVGKRFALGPEWKPGNAYWDRAEAALQKDFEAWLNRAGARDQQEEANLRKTLEELSEAQLDEVLSYFRSDLLCKATLMADAAMAMLTWGLALGRNEPDAQMKRRLEKLQRELEDYKLTPDEERALEKAMQGTGVQLVMRNTGASVLSALSNPKTLLQPRATPATIENVAWLIAQFREAYNVPSPLSPDKAALDRRLLEAVKSVNMQSVRELLDAGANLEVRDGRPHLLNCDRGLTIARVRLPFGEDDAHTLPIHLPYHARRLRNPTAASRSATRLQSRVQQHGRAPLRIVGDCTRRFTDMA